MPVTRYDIFFAVAAQGDSDEKDIKNFLSVHDDMLFAQDVQLLVSDKLLERHGSILKYPANNQNASLLFNVLSFTVTHNINYNSYISSPMLVFLEQTYAQNYFSIADVQQFDDMKRINISILRKDGFLLMMEESPFRAKIIQNSFFDIILKLNRRSVANTDKKRKTMSVEAMLMEEMIKKQMAAKFGSAIASPKPEIPYYEEDDPVKGVFLHLSREQKAIKAILSLKNQEALNVTFTQNLQKAQELMRRNVSLRKGLSAELIVEYHKVLMDDPEIGGIFRTEQVVVAGNPHFKICPHNKIKDSLNKLLDRYAKAKFKGLPDVVKFGAYLHNELQHIHPFVDGNSRLTRLVMQHFFSLYNLPDYEIPVPYISRYTALTKGARNRDDNKLFELLKEIFLYMMKVATSSSVVVK